MMCAARFLRRTAKFPNSESAFRDLASRRVPVSRVGAVSRALSRKLRRLLPVRTLCVTPLLLQEDGVRLVAFWTQLGNASAILVHSVILPLVVQQPWLACTTLIRLKSIADKQNYSCC